MTENKGRQRKEDAILTCPLNVQYCQRKVSNLPDAFIFLRITSYYMIHTGFYLDIDQGFIIIYFSRRPINICKNIYVYIHIYR